MTGQPLDYAKLKAFGPHTRRIEWSAAQTILYALWVGAAELDFVYETRLRALPTLPGIWAAGAAAWANPAFGIDPRSLVHAEQEVELHGPVPVEGVFAATGVIERVVAKGRHALVTTASRVADAAGDVFATVRSTIMARGAGGFTGDAPPPLAPPKPDRAADVTLTLPTASNQALLYRLSGDLNPIHIDPELARAAGFARPLLHGMCSYGIVGRGLIAAFCGNDPAGLAALRCRFAAPFYPGETLRLDIWRLGPGELRFCASTQERGGEVLSHGFARLA